MAPVFAAVMLWRVMDYLKPGLARRRAVLNSMMDGISGAKVLDPAENLFCYLLISSTNTIFLFYFSIKGITTTA